MTQTDPHMKDLDALLASSQAPAPSQDLMVRILHDALAEQPVPMAGQRRSWMARFAPLIGGWQGLGGLVAATCAGLWIGISPPDNLPEGLSAFLNVQDMTVQQDPGLNGFGWDLEEG